MLVGALHKILWFAVPFMVIYAHEEQSVSRHDTCRVDVFLLCRFLHKESRWRMVRFFKASYSRLRNCLLKFLC